jgi:hypothetical protein
MSSLPNVRAAHHQSHAEPATITTLAAAQDRFTARAEELRRKAGKILGKGRNQASQERIVDALSLTWYRWVALVENGNASEANLTSAFYWSCRQVTCGRVMPDDESFGSKTDPFRTNMQRHGIGRSSWDDGVYEKPCFRHQASDIPEISRDGDNPADIVQVKLDSADWLDTLSATWQGRFRDFLDGLTTKEMAIKWRVTAPAVSQWRRWLADSYTAFVGH